MDHLDERVKALQKRSLQVLPLRYRRETLQKLLPIEALCEYDTDEVRATFTAAAASGFAVWFVLHFHDKRGYTAADEYYGYCYFQKTALWVFSA